MYVTISQAGVTLAEPDNLRSLEVRSILSPERTAEAATAIGRRDGAHLWIDSGWLRAQGPADAAWQADFDNMLAFARRAGWIDADGRVRAHIVYS